MTSTALPSMISSLQAKLSVVEQQLSDAREISVHVHKRLPQILHCLEDRLGPGYSQVAADCFRPFIFMLLHLILSCAKATWK